jgi:predicted outer membrane protein
MRNEVGRWQLVVVILCGGFAAAGAEAAELSSGDVRFVRSAEAALSIEIAMSEMVGPRTNVPAIKNFATSVIDDYHKANLEMLALSDVDPASATVDPVVEKERSGLAPLADHNFERRYLTDMVKYHQQAIALFEKQLPSVDNKRLKELAEVTLARLSTHLGQARALLTAK